MKRQKNQVRFSVSNTIGWWKFGSSKILTLVLVFVLLVLSLGIGTELALAQEASSVTETQAVQGVLTDQTFLGVPLFDNDIYKMVVRFSFNLFFVALVVGVSYYPNQKNQRYVFNFLVMNIVVFFICFTLKKLELELGMALGLFAIFAIIRYRTDQIAVKDMTYLFVVIGLAVINALSNKKTSYVELVFTNAAVFGVTLFLETALFNTRKKVRLSSRDIVYDRLDLLHPGRESELHADLAARTGIQPERVDVKKIDLLKGSAAISLRYAKTKNDKGLKPEIQNSKSDLNSEI